MEPSSERLNPARFPVLTCALVSICALLLASPDLAERLALDRSAFLAGQAWRLLSGHLVHGFGPAQLADLSALLVLGAWLERASRRQFLAVLLASALASSIAILGLTGYARYVGSSALACGLFVAACARLARSPAVPRHRLVGLAGLALFLLELVLDLSGVAPSELVGLPRGAQVATVAHALGGAAGLVVVLAWKGVPRRARRDPAAPAPASLTARR